MKKFTILMGLFLSIVISGSAFAWEVKTSNDAFDGETKIWYVKAENDPRYVLYLRWKEKADVVRQPKMEIILDTPMTYICKHGNAQTIVDGREGPSVYGLNTSRGNTAIFFSYGLADVFQDSEEMILRIKGGCGGVFTKTFKYGKASKELIDKLNLDNLHSNVSSLLINIKLDGKREGMRKFCPHENCTPAKEVMAKWPQYFKELK